MGDLANDMIDGFSCSWCGTYFEEPHGYPVLCDSCHSEQKGNDIPKHTYAEL